MQGIHLSAISNTDIKQDLSVDFSAEEAPACFSRRQKIADFERCETCLLSSAEACPGPALINRYMDRALDLADSAGHQGLLHLRESWLRRAWITLRNSALLPHRSEAWRSLCLIALYQLFFVFRHLFADRPGAAKRLSAMTRDMAIMTRQLL
ncbi:MAG: hypothetical protein CMI00_01100 [Oceanospirillaceae bacterium]|nr:hypothetical protein [Oceanospirillaceae bacterium]|tara:strand:- start:651 stop:1106 length:456 start_codon:yes stop_codon:yes gene_type:complete